MLRKTDEKRRKIMTLEDKRRIARENGRKSRGPKGPRRRNERFLPRSAYPSLLIDEAALPA